jgi:hypothetical protein
VLFPNPSNQSSEGGPRTTSQKNTISKEKQNLRESLRRKEVQMAVSLGTARPKEIKTRSVTRLFNKEALR